MNIIKKIKIANKISKAVKEIKKFLDETHLDSEIKEGIELIKAGVNKILTKAPQLSVPYNIILDIFKSEK